MNLTTSTEPAANVPGSSYLLGWPPNRPFILDNIVITSMKFQRYNTSEANPNPHISFITPLKGDASTMTVALDILKALAAQVRPVMKKHG
jgi:hypothetical protein